ncbi:unnamed protein product (macronuclear) [Paramecium tetraurelia]|uniref:HSF-type DNA-binding domain-containing protein n=1 Tax=Paramecium tetraurelia TaxID=5888 RepID=A0BFQ9_PARTE|nr:uncharacterized protein GSPATT00028411001 [Paramecium tetraurelia]CAK57376.1 unnamed protein product [Paramecium tetraurelia]|eukprot:XP_001424774.1 hypothetical protein (macronuclear) [Paramecium tetraurelia strain d4-2]
MSKSRSQSSIPAFLQKTYDILENPQLQDIVGWNEDGSGFLVKNVIAFQDQVLPMYFKHRNFASFVRQMNMYGFHKSRSDLKENEFIHPHFRKDQRNLLKKIKRKSGEHIDEQFAIMELKPHRNTNLQDKQIQEILTKQQELEKVCKILIEQNNKILQCNQQLRNQLVQERFNGNKKIQKLKDYFLGQQQMQTLEDDPLQKRSSGALYQTLESDNEDLIVVNKKKVKEDDSDSTIERMGHLYPPLMLTNAENQDAQELNEDGIIQLLGDQQLDDLYFD